MPELVKSTIAAHITTATSEANDAYLSASEDEDTLIGHWGGLLNTRARKVYVQDAELRGDWTWSINYYKFRGRGRGATESVIGADGIVELKLKTGFGEEAKSAMFQSKNGWGKDARLVSQCMKMSNWREAAFVINFDVQAYEAYLIDDVIRARGSRPDNSLSIPLASFLGDQFLNCLVGDTDLIYDARKKILIWRNLEGNIVSTEFSAKHRITVEVRAPKETHYVGKEISNDEIYKHRMQTSKEEILSIDRQFSQIDLKAARNKAISAYHPDRFGESDSLLRQLAIKRSQEINEAYDYLKIEIDRDG